MGKYLAALVVLISLFACKHKKPLKGGQPVEPNEFFEAYRELKLPVIVSDTNMKKIADTGTVSYAVFTQFLPDSLLNNPFGKDRKLTIRPAGKIVQKSRETYFITYVSSKNTEAVYLSVYDKNKFLVSMPLLTQGTAAAVVTASIDKRLTIVQNKEWIDKDVLYYNRIIYAYNNVGIFTTVLTETNVVQNTGATISNPLDTFARKNKYSGDFAKGSKNFLAIRDGKTAGAYLFFIHFENDSKDDPCSGELKGELKITSDKTGVYKSNGDPCLLDFGLTLNQIKVKETGSCGNYRGIKCFFNDTYTRKKEPKTAAKKK